MGSWFQTHHKEVVMGIILFCIIGLAAGWLAGKIMRGGGFGFGGNLAVGVLGALVGGLLFRVLGLSAESLVGSLITATVGAIVLLWLAGLIRR
jgi:uncharacterized membrane protein YeaQ/YmgE (transglycosylase-associated protein family)